MPYSRALKNTIRQDVPYPTADVARKPAVSVPKFAASLGTLTPAVSLRRTKRRMM